MKVKACIHTTAKQAVAAAVHKADVVGHRAHRHSHSAGELAQMCVDNSLIHTVFEPRRPAVPTRPPSRWRCRERFAELISLKLRNYRRFPIKTGRSPRLLSIRSYINNSIARVSGGRLWVDTTGHFPYGQCMTLPVSTVCSWQIQRAATAVAWFAQFAHIWLHIRHVFPVAPDSKGRIIGLKGRGLLPIFLFNAHTHLGGRTTPVGICR